MREEKWWVVLDPQIADAPYQWLPEPLIEAMEAMHPEDAEELESAVKYGSGETVVHGWRIRYRDDDREDDCWDHSANVGYPYHDWVGNRCSHCGDCWPEEWPVVSEVQPIPGWISARKELSDAVKEYSIEVVKNGGKREKMYNKIKGLGKEIYRQMQLCRKDRSQAMRAAQDSIIAASEAMYDIADAVAEESELSEDQTWQAYCDASDAAGDAFDPAVAGVIDELEKKKMKKERLRDVINLLSVALTEKNEFVVDMSVGGWADQDDLGNTCGCFAGFWGWATDDGESNPDKWKDMADDLAFFLELEDRFELKQWAKKNSEIWGNKYGEKLYSNEEAFGIPRNEYGQEINGQQIIDHLQGVYERLEASQASG